MSGTLAADRVTQIFGGARALDAVSITWPRGGPLYGRAPPAALIYQHAGVERDRAAASYMDEQIAALDRTEKGQLRALPNTAG